MDIIYLTAEFLNFDMKFQIHLKYRKSLWNTWPFLTQSSWYHFTIYSVKTAIHAAHCLKQTILNRKYQIHLPRWRFIFHNFIVVLSDNITFYVPHNLPDTAICYKLQS